MNSPIDGNTIVRVAGDAIIAADGGGAIILWNPAAERIFGFSANEALGRSLDLIIPERFRQRHWEAYRQTMASGETKYGEDVLRVPALHKAGHTLSIAFKVALVKSAENGVEGIVAIVRDETKQWNENRKCREQSRQKL